jgi:hypothetical protein
MGRKRRWYENMEARFPKGTFARIEAVLMFVEARTDFIRIAVEREISRRERQTVEERAHEEDFSATGMTYRPVQHDRC